MSTALEQCLIGARMRLAIAHRQFLEEVLAAVHDACIEAIERAFVEMLDARARPTFARRDTPASAASPPFAPTAVATTPTGLVRMQEAFASTEIVDSEGIASAAAGPAAPDIRRKRAAAARRALTSEELTAVRAHATALIREQPDQGTTALARSLGIPTTTLRRQLQRLASEGAICIEERFSDGHRRHTYRSADPLPAQRPEPPPLAAEASA
jgi:hypothetical protein